MILCLPRSQPDHWTKSTVANCWEHSHRIITTHNTVVTALESLMFWSLLLPLQKDSRGDEASGLMFADGV